MEGLGQAGTLVPSYGKQVGDGEQTWIQRGAGHPCPNAADGFGERLGGSDVMSPFTFSSPGGLALLIPFRGPSAHYLFMNLPPLILQEATTGLEEVLWLSWP